jgi:hypothetical protein
VLEIGGDHVIARADHSLDRQVQAVSTVIGENPALGRGTTEELVEHVAGAVEHALGVDRHAMAGASGVRQMVPGELIEGHVNGFGLGETGCRVIEINHVRLPFRRLLATFNCQCIESKGCVPW